MSDETKQEHHEHNLEGNDAMNLLLEIWFCGFSSGAATAASAHHPTVPGPAIAAEAQRVLELAEGDPLFVERVRTDINKHVHTAAHRGGL